MSFKFFLVIVVLVNGGWTLDPTEGWGPREQESWSICIERKNFFNKNLATTDRKAICRKYMVLKS